MERCVWSVIRASALAGVVGAGLVACNRGPTTTPKQTTSSTPSTAPSSSTPATTSSHPSSAPDNTARNARDKDGTTVTPPDQGETEADRRITADIRKALMSNSLSTDAQNCKIITRDGVVTLRGPVKTADEKALVGSVAQSVTGVRSVVNELETKS